MQERLLICPPTANLLAVTHHLLADPIILTRLHAELQIFKTLILLLEDEPCFLSVICFLFGHLSRIACIYDQHRARLP